MMIALWLLTMNMVVMMASSSDINPCKVQNVIIEPYFGINAKTKELIDILQAPPLLTQKLHADICVTTDIAYLTSNMQVPRFICRQRYSAVEVYSKSRGDLQDITELSVEQIAKEFVKDFVLIEAGCDVFMNFLPSRVISRQQEKALMKADRLHGVASLHGSGENNSETEIVPPSIQNRDENATLEDFTRNYKNTTLLRRSMIKSDYFRKGMHLESPVNAIQNTTNLRNFKNITSTETQRETEDSSVLQEGEILLTSENIGLPLLILEASFDPVMQIISHYSIK